MVARKKSRKTTKKRVRFAPLPAMGQPTRTDHLQVQRQAYANTVKSSAISTIYSTFGVLMLVGLGLMVYKFQQDQSKSSEKYIGNVGGQSTLSTMQREPSKKLLQCYQDMDCPDQTRCSEKGICVPRVHKLPLDFHLRRMGAGREKENPTTNN